MKKHHTLSPLPPTLSDSIAFSFIYLPTGLWTQMHNENLNIRAKVILQ